MPWRDQFARPLFEGDCAAKVNMDSQKGSWGFMIVEVEIRVPCGT